MAVYKIESDTAYPYLALLDGREIRNLPWFKGYSVQQDWHDLPVGFTEKVSLKSGGDFPHFSSNGTLVCSAKALQQLERLIADSVEIFKLNCVNCGDEDFYALNVLNVVDCLDYSRSTISHHPSGRMKYPVPMFLRPDCFDKKPIFKIPEWVLTDIFVTDAFKDIVEQNNLEGLIFTKIET